MPWSPSYDDASPDPRLDLFRGRAGVLSLDGADVGHVLVETDLVAHLEGGRLWWRRWGATEEFALVSARIDDGGYDGDMLMPDELDGPTTRWALGEFDHGSTTYAVRWLDQAESDRVHHEVFGHHH